MTYGIAHYRTMHFDSICRLRVNSIAAPDAGLALWVNGPVLPKCIELMKRWGFTYKSDLLTWVKTTSTGSLHSEWAILLVRVPSNCSTEHVAAG